VQDIAPVDWEEEIGNSTRKDHSNAFNQAPDGRSKRVVRRGTDGVLTRKALDFDEVFQSSQSYFFAFFIQKKCLVLKLCIKLIKKTIL
jgi:hypothetical protein